MITEGFINLSQHRFKFIQHLVEKYNNDYLKARKAAILIEKVLVNSINLIKKSCSATLIEYFDESFLKLAKFC